MIKSISIQHFKGHSNTTVEFDSESRLCCLVGPNGVGKTSVLEALVVLSEIVLDGLDEACEDSERRGDLTRRGMDRFKIELAEPLYENGSETPEKEPDYSWRLSVEVKEIEGEYQAALDWFDRRSGTELTETETTTKSTQKLPDAIRREIDHPRLVQLTLADLRAHSAFKSEHPQMSGSGAGIASLIAYWAMTDPARIDQLIERAQRLLPAVKGIRVFPKRVKNSSGETDRFEHELVVDTVTGNEIPARLASEGTLMGIALLAILADPNPPRIILIDDVERGLHPKAQRQFMGVLLEILNQNPELQIMLTTHSPFVVEEVPATAVWVMGHDQEGVIRTAPLVEHPKAKEALEKLTNGEFWGAVGESWAADIAKQETKIEGER